MPQLIDLTNKRFGRWSVIKRTYPNTNDGKAKWLCKCDCGTMRTVSGHNLKLGISNSCGCLNRENLNKANRLSYGLANMHTLILKYKWGAKKRGLEYTLTEEQFKELTSGNCYYCGEKPSKTIKAKGSYGEYRYNGIDRKDSNLGYTLENTVSCCKTCNFRKRITGFQEFKEWIKKVYINLNKNNSI